MFRTEELVVRRHPERRELEALELPDPKWPRILESARASGLGVVAEAYDRPSRDVALAAGVSALLSAASDVDHPELLRSLGGGGVPVLLATGGADDALVRDAVAAAGGDVALVLGPAESPAPVEELRLSAIAAARERFRTSVGVLDATDGGSAFALVAPALAASHGAELVLKRLVLDRGERGRDGASAVSPRSCTAASSCCGRPRAPSATAPSPAEPRRSAGGRSSRRRSSAAATSSPPSICGSSARPSGPIAACGRPRRCG